MRRALLTACFLLMVVLTPGCKKDDAGGFLADCDVTPPLAGAISPTCGATQVAINQAVNITFSESIEPSSLTADSFWLMGPGEVPVPGTVVYSGSTNIASFTPTNNLAPFTTYTYTLQGGQGGIEDLFTNVLANNFTCSFTTGGVPDNTPPTVTATVPLNNATGVSLNSIVTATFSEAMDPLTISSSTFLVRGPGGAVVPGSITYAGSSFTAVFTPTGNLAPSTTYTATVTSGSKDLSGNALAADYVWSFATGAAQDLTAPRVIATDPLDNAVGVALDKTLTATFGEMMDPTTITSYSFTLRQGGTTIPGTVTYSGTVATFNPTVDLLPNTVYTARVTTDAEDLAGNALAENHVWVFTTLAILDLTAPRVLSTDPANNATGVAINKSVTATFSEAMDPLTINTSTFTVHNGSASISGTVTYAGPTFAAIFNPTSDFAPNTTYTGRITTGAKDPAGNGIAADYVWTFTTAAALDSTAPTVVSTDPANLETGVILNKSVNATFSEAMNPTTISSSTFTLSQGLNSIAGSVSYLGTTATFNPTADFLANTTYTGRITTGAKDPAGNGIAADYVWTFTTGSPVVGILPVNLTCAEGFATLAGSTITSTGPTIVNGDVGLSPGSALVGFPPGIINGVVHVNDPIANNAKGCLTAAFNDAAGRAPGASVAGNIGGLTLTPGVYTSNSTLAISGGNLTLDAQGDANGVFIFQIASAFTMTSGRQVILAGGAQAKNVFWQVGSSATIGTTAIMMGIILADQSITLETGATLNGSALTRIAAVSLDSSTVTAQ